MDKKVVDPKKVKLTEKDIEDWLFDNCEAIDGLEGIRIERWVARQLRVPSGVIDLLGKNRNLTITVVEIKNQAIKSDALAQVCRYAADVKNVLFEFSQNPAHVHKIVVGIGQPESKVQYEANALEVGLLSFETEFSLKVNGPWMWTEEHQKEIDDFIVKLSNSDAFTYYREFEAWLKSTYDKSEVDIVEEARKVIDENAKDE